MPEPTPNTNSIEQQEPQQSFEAKIAALDRQYGVEDFDPEDTLKRLYVRRNTGTIEPWLLVGQGPVAGKLESRDEKGGPQYKYVDLAKLTIDQEALEMEHMIQRAKAVTDLGAEANEAVPVIGPSNPLITEVPSFAKPTQGDVSAALEQPVEHRESVDNDRFAYLRTALPPTVRPADAGSSGFNYDRLLSGDKRDGLGNQQGRGFGTYEPETEEDKQRKYYDKFVTVENGENSLIVLDEAVKAIPELGDILRRYNLTQNLIGAVDAIRENPDVRFEVARLLAKRLDALATDPYSDLGWRIKQNSPNNLKTDPITGRRMLSRTYAIDMALKMIGGEFSERAEEYDPIKRNAKDEVIGGMHRHAANATLRTYYLDVQ